MKEEAAMPDHTAAVKLVISKLTDDKVGVIRSLTEIDAVGHRMVHGGENFSGSVIINEEVIKAIEDCNDLAPLHNPANLIGVRSCQAIMPGVPMVAVFDTAFHQTMPEKAYLYGLPYDYYKKYKIRRYGFHGTSHDFVSKRAAEILGKDRKDLKIIVCHFRQRRIRIRCKIRGIRGHLHGPDTAGGPDYGNPQRRPGSRHHFLPGRKKKA